MQLPGLSANGEIQCQVVNWRLFGKPEPEIRVWTWVGGDVAQVSRPVALNDPDVVFRGHLMRIGPFETIIREYDPGRELFVVERLPAFGEN